MQTHINQTAKNATRPIGSVAYLGSRAFIVLVREGENSMTNRDRHFKVRIKDREQFKAVFPLSFENNEMPDIGRFILSILGESIWVRKVSNHPNSFCYVPVEDDRYIIMPNWIDWYETEEMVPSLTNGGLGNSVVLEDILVVAE